MPRRNLTLLMCALVFTALCQTRSGKAPQGRYANEAYQAIDAMALERPSRQELLDGAMRGMMGVLNERGDVHSQYIGPKRAQSFLDVMRQEFGGVGVRLRMMEDPERLLLIGPPEPGSPAEQGGIRPNDQVVKVDGEPIQGMTIEEIIDLMRGVVGEPIVLTILHEEEQETVDIRLVRDVIPMASVIGDRRLSDGDWHFLLDEDPRIAYIRLTNFGTKTVEELRDTLDQLGRQGAKSLVLDVRENSGGSLKAAVGVCNLFLPAGKPIVETRGRDQQVEQAYHASGEGRQLKMPVVVLINQNTASASEIVAAALQDNHRAKVAGQRSFGKGTVQQIIPMQASKTYLKLTTSSYWRPSGKNIHRLSNAKDEDQWGVKPDPELKVELKEEAHEQFALWRGSRDLTVFDDQTGEPISTPPLLSDETPPPADYRDKCLDRAVEHLQSMLDAGA